MIMLVGTPKDFYMHLRSSTLGRGRAIVMVPLLASTMLIAQASPSNSASTSAAGDVRYQQMEDQIRAVLSELGETRHELQDSRQKIEDLQNHLASVEKELATRGASDTQPSAMVPTPDQSATDLRSAVDHLQEQTDILQSQVKQHEQTKLESSSKYPIKLSGLILFNTYVNDGAVDNIDLPILALSRTPDIAHGSISGSMRQTILGLDARGPRLVGARTSGDVHIDFFGGIYDGDWNPYAGHVRLRTAHMKLDWGDTSLQAAIDGPIYSPVEPTSYASVGAPSLAWSGNLWTWAPQIVLTHQFEAIGAGRPKLEFGLMDPQPPESPPNGGTHQPGASERSKQPAYQARVSYSIGEDGEAMTIGAGGYYSLQRYAGSPNVNSWVGTADWLLPITKYLEVSGQFYRGSALGGQGGGTFKDVYTDNHSIQRGLDDVGGWGQIKGKLNPRLEVNGAFGLDNAFGGELHSASFYEGADVYDFLARNRTISANFIYRPRAYLLFSSEYRNIHSWQTNHVDNTANSMSLSAGYLF